MSSIETQTIDWTEYEKSHPVTIPPALTDPHPITQKTMAVLSQIPGQSAALPKSHCDKIFYMRVSERHQDRALLLVDTLLKACDARGFELRHDDDNPYHHGISVFVDEEPVPLTLIERGGVVTYLTLEIGSSWRGPKRVWKDHPRRRLEERLNKLMIALRSISHRRIADRERQLEDERREMEFLRQRAALRRKVENEEDAVDALITDTENWYLAQKIRAYVSAAKAQPSDEGDIAKFAKWVIWANEHADRLDPLRPSPPSVLDTPYDAYREPELEEYIDDDGNIAHA